MAGTALTSGALWLADLGSGVGREQHGKRPVVVLSNRWHIRAVDQLVIIAPCTSRDRNWPNHVAITGSTILTTPTFAMTEQVRTISRERLLRNLGAVDDAVMDEIHQWVSDWMAWGR